MDRPVIFPGAITKNNSRGNVPMPTCQQRLPDCNRKLVGEDASLHHSAAGFVACRLSLPAITRAFAPVNCARPATPFSPSALGSQVTGVGVVKMTLLDAMGDMDNLPSVQIEHI
jgi:hypothetical protein